MFSYFEPNFIEEKFFWESGYFQILVTWPSRNENAKETKKKKKKKKRKNKQSKTKKHKVHKFN